MIIVWMIELMTNKVNWSRKKNYKFLEKSIYFWLAFENYCFHCYQSLAFFESWDVKSSYVKSFLNKLYTPKVVTLNVPKRDNFVQLPFLRSTSFQIWKKLLKLFGDKLTSCNLKIIFSSPSRINYLRCYFQDLFTSVCVVAPMLPVMERPNAILNSEFVDI